MPLFAVRWLSFFRVRVRGAYSTAGAAGKGPLAQRRKTVQPLSREPRKSLRERIYGQARAQRRTRRARP
jgi:hypothetical protein